MKKAQSLIEYTVLLAAVIALIALVLYQPTSGIQARLNTTYNRMGEAIENVTNALTTQVFGIQ